jgi:hydrogenase maturation protein HypF
VVGLSCDGVGYGDDGAAWGGEVLVCEAAGYQRFAHLAYFPLAGGDKAAIETWRPAAALLREAYGGEWRDWAGRLSRFDESELDTIQRLMDAGVNCPPTSSLGRVFDGVSFLLGRCERNRHEAEAAMAVEAIVSDAEVEPYDYSGVPDREPAALSLAPMLRGVVDDVLAERNVSGIAARFHETIARMLVTAAQTACERRNIGTVALSGGCFANRRLLSRVVELSEASGLRVLYHRRVPCGDGGLSLGQAVAAAAMLERKSPCA